MMYFCTPRTPLIRMMSCGLTEPSVSRSPAFDLSPLLTRSGALRGSNRSDASPSPVTVMSRLRLTVVLDADHAVEFGDDRLPFGLAGFEEFLDAGQTLGDVVAEAMPPVWKVRIVSWVPGSPMDWAAMMPTASPPTAGSPEARLTP